MNSTNTHLTIINGKVQYMFTGTYDKCTNGCLSEEIVPVVCCGLRDDKGDRWTYICKFHLNEIKIDKKGICQRKSDSFLCPKQICNYCNKKSIIKNQPKICHDCAIMILDNCVLMTEICQFPVLSREKCKCQFCNQVLRK